MFPCSHMGLDYLLDVNIFQYIVSGDYVLASFFFLQKKKHNKFLLVFLCLFIPSLFFFKEGRKGKEILAIT